MCVCAYLSRCAETSSSVYTFSFGTWGFYLSPRVTHKLKACQDKLRSICSVCTRPQDMTVRDESTNATPLFWLPPPNYLQPGGACGYNTRVHDPQSYYLGGKDPPSTPLSSLAYQLVGEIYLFPGRRAERRTVGWMTTNGDDDLGPSRRLHVCMYACRRAARCLYGCLPPLTYDYLLKYVLDLRAVI